MTTMDVMNGIPHLLWTTSWQAGVMAGAVWLACRQWPRMPANLRVMLWWLVSLKFAIGLVWIQPVPLPVLPASLTPADIEVASVASVAPLTNASIDTIGSNLSTSTGSARSSAVSAMVSYSLAAATGIWLLGVLVQGALLVRQLVRTRQLIARSQPVEGDAAELFDDLAARMNLRASCPRLRVSTAIATPQVTGLRRPVILLPVGALESFSARELSLTLCHELMHVKRFDLWHGWIPSIAARLFFFHPLARLAAHEYAIAREAACDARVLAFMDAPACDYGRLLMRLGITAREAAPAAAGASPTLRTLKRRLIMLHDASPHARALSPRWWALAAVAAILVIPIRPTAAQNHQNSENLQNQRNPPADPHKEDRGEPWLFVQDDNTSAMHGSSMDLEEAKRLRAAASEPLIWFKRDGRAYVIRDRETLDKARGLFIPQERVHKAMRGLDERQTILGAQQTAFGETQEAMREQLRVIEEKVKEATANVQKTIAPPARPSEDARLRVTEEIRLREMRLQEAEARRREATAHQEVLGMQQRALGEQQAALGAEQEALSRQLDEMHRSVEWEMRNLFSNAIAAGIATPIK